MNEYLFCAIKIDPGILDALLAFYPNILWTNEKITISEYFKEVPPENRKFLAWNYEDPSFWLTDFPGLKSTYIKIVPFSEAIKVLDKFWS